MLSGLSHDTQPLFAFPLRGFVSITGEKLIPANPGEKKRTPLCPRRTPQGIERFQIEFRMGILRPLRRRPQIQAGWVGIDIYRFIAQADAFSNAVSPSHLRMALLTAQ